MREAVIPRRLKSGDHVRVIAPSCSLSMISDDVRAVANRRFVDLGLRLSFGEHAEETNEFTSSSVELRVADLHAAFADKSVDAILTAIGGYNVNQLLPHVDWSIVEANPKIFCGYSDITALCCAIYTKTSLVTYSGPHYSSFGMIEHFEQTLNWFKSALFDEGPLDADPAATWSDDIWYLKQHTRNIIDNEGHWAIQPGSAEGQLMGGNLSTLNLLQGTKYMPDLDGAVLFIEVEMTRAKLELILASKRELKGLPIIANVDFGHTDPLLTIPVGGHVRLSALADHQTSILISS